MKNIISCPLLTVGVFTLKSTGRSVSPFHKHRAMTTVIASLCLSRTERAGISPLRAANTAEFKPTAYTNRFRPDFSKPRGSLTSIIPLLVIKQHLQCWISLLYYHVLNTFLKPFMSQKLLYDFFPSNFSIWGKYYIYIRHSHNNYTILYYLYIQHNSATDVIIGFYHTNI
jgi:hypothetical protein